MLKEDTHYIKRTIAPEVWRAARAEALKEEITIGKWLEKLVRKELGIEEKQK
jgi:hypothetical protein